MRNSNFLLQLQVLRSTSTTTGTDIRSLHTVEVLKVETSINNFYLPVSIINSCVTVVQ